MNPLITDALTINISWEWALGIVGVLVVIAWQGSARFTALETSMEWIKKEVDGFKKGISQLGTDVDELNGDMRTVKFHVENLSLKNPAFSSQSPISLTNTGEEWLLESGLKAYIDAHPDDFLRVCQKRKVNNPNPYEVQGFAFETLNECVFESEFEDSLKRFAFAQGTTLGVLRRVGGIYLRDLCLQDFGMNTKDIDKHAPDKPV